MDNLTEEQIKFMSACVIQALTHLREKKIIHRDILMKNIIMDNDRYFNLIDFSFSINYKNKDNKNYYVICYEKARPPEIFSWSEYDYNSDYYRLGSIIHFLIFKLYPLDIKKSKKIKEYSVDFNKVNNYSKNCIDFMNKLIISDYKKRIGYNDINELKNHSWFKEFNWKKLKEKKINSPFNFVSNIKKENCSKMNESLNLISIFKNYSKEDFYKTLIKNFDYINNNSIERLKNY